MTEQLSLFLSSPRLRRLQLAAELSGCISKSLPRGMAWLGLNVMSVLRYSLLLICSAQCMNFFCHLLLFLSSIPLSPLTPPWTTVDGDNKASPLFTIVSRVLFLLHETTVVCTAFALKHLNTDNLLGTRAAQTILGRKTMLHLHTCTYLPPISTVLHCVT